MGIKKKVGKQRRDKYYHLAKETGFRSRAAFKLLQLNRKYTFLEKSRVLLDLCAAPGGWMQVAQQNMPVSSVVVGVDLFPIKPIPGCIGLVEDITTDKCKVSIRKALQNWKADVVLHDGAPNVGTNWLFDAYQQACLTLSALKLATEFLREGGWFISKVFRSKDYNPLLWVLTQLFKKVHATKPQASRNESAEIFVVCQYYKAPTKLDPKFLQPEYVFKELELDPRLKINLLRAGKPKKPKAEGYREGDYTCFTSIPITEFIQTSSGIEILQRASELVFNDDEILNHPKTTNEIKECCKDIRVLGRKELRALLAWKKIIKEFLTNREKKEEDGEEEMKEEVTTSEVPAIDQDEIELHEIEKHIAEVKEEEMRAQKKKKRVADKERKKLEEKMSLKMVLEGDQGPTLEAEDTIFNLRQIRSVKELVKVTDQAPDTVAESEPESDDDALPRPKKVRYEKEENHLDSSGKFYKEDESEAEEDDDDDDSVDLHDGLGLSESEDDDDALIRKPKDKNKNPLLTDLDNRGRKEKRLNKVAMWFEKEAFKNLETEADEDYELDVLSEEVKKQGGKVLEKEKKGSKGKEKKGLKEKEKKAAKKVRFAIKGKDDGSDTSESESESESEPESDSSNDSDYNVEKTLAKKKQKEKKLKDNEFEVVPKEDGKSGRKKRKLNEEGLALGTLMVSSKKTKRDLVDSAWNRYAFNDDHLPEWFTEDEKKHMQHNVQIPEALVTEYKNKLKEINARPIKKVVEAKARKKRRMLKKLDRAKKKVEHIMDNIDVSEREKARQIQKLYKKINEPRKKEVTYIVAKKHTATKRARRPTGIKGPYKVVDPRMKKDNLKQKQNQNQKRGRKAGKKGGRQKGKKR